MKNKNLVKTIKTSFTGDNLTNYFGIYPLFKFMKIMGLNHLFNQKISVIEKPNQKHSLRQIAGIKSDAYVFDQSLFLSPLHLKIQYL